MSIFSFAPILLGQQAFKSSATQMHPLGTMAMDKYGRKFRYAKAGASPLVVGDMLQGPVAVTTHQTCAVNATTAIGETSIAITLGITNAVVENQYAEGWALIDTAPGLGYQYQIISHPAAAGAAALVLTLSPDTPIQVALSTSSKVTLCYNPYKGVLQVPITTSTSAIVGCCQYIIAANEFGWIQTGGVASVLTKATPAAGAPVVSPGSAAGAVVVAAVDTTQTVGMMMAVGKDGTCCPVFLTID